MKREIKFRGKRVDNGEWVYGPLVYDDNNRPWIGIISVYGDPSNTLDYCEEVDPETVGQYTGMKDRNDCDIYEGDIVTGDGKDRLDYIVFDSGCFCLQEAIMFYEATYWGSEIKVNGNIHDNPELLEE